MSSGRTPNMVWNRVDQEPDVFKIAFFDHSIDHEKRFQMKTACGQNKKKKIRLLRMLSPSTFQNIAYFKNYLCFKIL